EVRQQDPLGAAGGSQDLELGGVELERVDQDVACGAQPQESVEVDAAIELRATPVAHVREGGLFEHRPMLRNARARLPSPPSRCALPRRQIPFASATASSCCSRRCCSRWSCGCAATVTCSRTRSSTSSTRKLW